jgi:sterol desaturase/sphingolipid hydroxylase (fatty acid hydroxylase superfamily)
VESPGTAADVAPIRLFKSDLLEFFTHIHPGAVVALWLPVILGFLAWAAAAPAPGRAVFIPACWVTGVFLWTLVEYCLHRFLFHYEARTEAGRRIFYLFHGVHHAQPMCKSRLVMPFVLSIPLGLLFYGAFDLVVGVIAGRSAWVAPLFAGIVSGYLAYDMMHYASHHFRLKSPLLKAIRKSHMQHHGSTHDMRFGVSSPLWDYVFGTMPRPGTPGTPGAPAAQRHPAEG